MVITARDAASTANLQRKKSKVEKLQMILRLLFLQSSRPV